jgi:ATP-dependent 26S proteasome regulatory subunit
MATNRAETLDAALIRPGRLDRRIEFGPPDFESLREIFIKVSGKMPKEENIRYDLMARKCQNLGTYFIFISNLAATNLLEVFPLKRKSVYKESTFKYS